MGYRKRIRYTEADKTLMWGRSQKGEALNAIARVFGRAYVGAAQRAAILEHEAGWQREIAESEARRYVTRLARLRGERRTPRIQPPTGIPNVRYRPETDFFTPTAEQPR